MLTLAACQIIRLRHDAQPSLQFTPVQAREIRRLRNADRGGNRKVGQGCQGCQHEGWV